MDHLFKERHNLKKLQIPSENLLEKIVKEVVKSDAIGIIPVNEPFNIRVKINEELIEIRGIVLENELRIGTFFIPEK
jgi:hypothetical protein